MLRHSFFSWWSLPVGLALTGGILGVLFSFLLPFQRASTVRVFITQPNAAGLDPYTAIKSTERVASSLSELIYTTTFFDNVLSQAKEIDPTHFPQDDQDRRELWRKTIETSITPGTGIMTITAFHVDPSQARLIVDGVAREMATQTPTYFGYNIRVQIIDAPLDSRWFARPKFGENAFIGAAIGGLLGMMLILMRMLRRIGE
jgi:capsular polysaccharide biosynthesis protein